MRARRTVVVGMLVLSLVLLTGVAVGARSGKHVTAAGNRAAARSDAKRLLSRLVLPPSATRSASLPVGPVVGLPGSRNLIDVAGWWTVPESLDQVMAFVDAHRPPGFTVTGSAGPGEVNGLPALGRLWSLPARPRVLSQRYLEVSAVQLPNGTTDVRGDGLDVWTLPRPSWEQLPAELSVLRVRIKRRTSRAVRATWHTSAVRKVRAVVRMVNALPARQPDYLHCGHGASRVVWLSFYRAHAAHPSAVAVIGQDPCGAIGLRLHGKAEPALMPPPAPGFRLPADNAWLARVGRVLGIRL